MWQIRRMKNCRNLFYLIAGCLSCAQLVVAEDPPPPRSILFFDLWKLDYWDNAALQQGEAEWVSQCNYTDPSFPDRGVYFPSVWRETDSGKWRMIYSVKWSPFTLMSAESEDGIKWKPTPHPKVSPPLDQEKAAPNHLFTLPSGSGSPVYRDPLESGGYPFRIFGRQSGEPVLERIRNDPAHPWRSLALAEGGKRYMDEGVALVSKDGVHWELQTGKPWNWQDEDWHPEPPVCVFWNEKRKRHVMAARPGWGDRRQCIRSSGDLQSWTEPQLQFQPDALDTSGPVGMYGLPVMPVGNGSGFAGLLWVFHNSSSEPVSSFNQFFGTMDAHFVYSYDGNRFFRGKREPFLKLNSIPHPGCTQIRPCSFVENDHWIYIYSEGHRGAHGRERSEQRLTKESLGSLLLHRVRKDGWMKLSSRGDWARIQTKPFVLRAPGITLNARANFGEIRFQLTDEKSQPIEGFAFEDSEPFRGKDVLQHELKWKDGSAGEKVLNTPLRLEIRFRQADIFSLKMSHHFLDAHDMWLLKDGKSLPAEPRFDF